MTTDHINKAFDDAMAPVTIVDWISYEDAEGKEESCGGMGGSVAFGDRWDDVFTNANKHLNALRAEILRLGLRNGGFWHQEEGVPVFSDGTVGTFSMRAWGDVLAATWATHEDVDYSYCDFAWTDGPTAEQAKAMQDAGKNRKPTWDEIIDTWLSKDREPENPS